MLTTESFIFQACLGMVRRGNWLKLKVNPECSTVSDLKLVRSQNSLLEKVISQSDHNISKLIS